MRKSTAQRFADAWLKQKPPYNRKHLVAAFRIYGDLVRQACLQLAKTNTDKIRKLELP